VDLLVLPVLHRIKFRSCLWVRQGFTPFTVYLIDVGSAVLVWVKKG